MSFASCGESANEAAVLSVDERPYTEFIGKKFAVLDGTGYESIVKSVFQSDDYMLFTNNDESLSLLDSGAVAGVIGDYTAAVPWVMHLGTDKYGLSRIPKSLASFEYCAMAKNDETAEEFNVFIEKLKSEGTLTDMFSRWVDGFDPDDVPTVAEIFTPVGGTANGSLTVGINTECAPFVMKDDDGSPTGFEVELMTRYADYAGKSVNFVDIPFADMLPFYTSGQADFIAAMCYDITEGDTGFIFTDSYAEALIAVVYKK
jgi:polar amino acid transport system substrate-binding protein